MDAVDFLDLDQSLRDSITGLVSALGGIEYAQPDQPYTLGDDALGCLKDIKKWVKFYGSNGKLDALRCIADTNLVSLDLCQILGQFKEGQENDKIKWRLALNCLELLVQLTWQIELDPNRATTIQYQYEAPLKFAQIGYKNAILHHPEFNILRPVVRVALPSMAIPRRDRPERDDHIISLLTCLLRNLVEISGRSTDSAGMDRHKNENARSEAILSFERSDIFNLIAALAAGVADEYEKIDCLLLEVLYHLVKGVNIEELFATPAEIRSKPLDDLSNMLRKEDSVKRQRKRFGSTRHNRFGTMISVVKENSLRLTVPGQTALQKDGTNTLAKLDSAKKFVKPNRPTEVNDLDRPVQLTPEALSILRRFITSFLETSFNPLFLSVTRAIERESSRCCDAHRSQALYVMSWFLRAHLYQDTKGAKGSEDVDYGVIASVFDPRCLVLVLRIMRDAADHKNWTELHAAMTCFEELLKAVQNMSSSNSEEYNEMANNILLNLFYDETNLDLIVWTVRSYHRQSFGYLDACTSLAHTVLKLLEHFSQDRRLYVKSKRQRLKAKNQHGDESESEDERTVTKRVAEKAFQFSAFEVKFMNDSCINTFRSFLDFYTELQSEQIKRVLTFFHRIFVKRKQQVLLYRLDICELLSRMANDEIHIPRDSSIRKHLEDFLKHYTNCLTKALKKTPVLHVELLFSKLPGTIYYLQHGEEAAPKPVRRPRAAAELEVRPGRSKEDQIAVVVATLLDDQKSEALDSMKTIIADVIIELRAWDLATAARLLGGGEENPDAQSAREPVVIDFKGESLRTAVFKDGKLQLLLKLIGAERIGMRDDPEALWIIPASVTTEDLETNLRLLKQYIDEPPSFEDGKSAAELLRRRAAPKPSYDDISGSDASDSDGSESSDKPHKPSKKRKRRQVDDAELEARREKRRLADLEKRVMIKSAVRIVDSDDDDESDLAFFERERALRERMAKKALEGDLPGSGTRAKAKKTGPAVSRRQTAGSPLVSDGDDDLQILGDDVPENQRGEGSENEDLDAVRPSKKHKVSRIVEISSDEE